MFRISQDYPTVENTELWSTYQKTHPQLYSSILSNDSYLLRYASNIWNVQFNNCVFHPPTNSIIIQTQFINSSTNLPFEINLPYQYLNNMNFTQLPDPLSNSITLQCLCEFYLLADLIIIRLPTTGLLSNFYPDLISNDGLIFKIPYNEISNFSIKDNLTKLSLSISSHNSLNNLTIFPLQRFPPQPLASGLFQPFSNLTPLQSLQLVENSITEGKNFINNLIQYQSNNSAKLVDSNSDITMNTNTFGSSNFNSSQRELLLSQSGQADDDDFNLMYEDQDHDSGNNSMQIEMIGGFQSTGTKRLRRESDDVVSNSASLKQQRNTPSDF